MRTLNIVISDIEYDKFGIKTDQLSFTDFVDMVSRELSRQTLSRCVELAERYGIAGINFSRSKSRTKQYASFLTQTLLFPHSYKEAIRFLLLTVY